MKKLLLLLFLISIQSFANEPDSKFYEPSVSNKYQGRLLSTTESYPIETMKKLCKPYTGIDTAQIRCRKQTKENTVICDYKCSLHWMVN